MTTPRERLLQESRELFFELGYSRVSMDEIASRLGMSKRTIYQLVPSKQELLRQALLEKLEEISSGLERIIEAEDLSFIRKLQHVGLFMVRNLPRPSRHFMRDMEQHCAPLWQEIDRARSETIQRRFKSLFEEGKKQRQLRPEMDSELIVRAFVGMIQNTIRPDVLSRMPFSISQAYSAIFELFCLGLLSDQGRSHFLEGNSEAPGDENIQES